MARLVGIDIERSRVRAVLLTTRYRAVTIERMLEMEVASPEDLPRALQACVLPLVEHGEAIAVGIQGDATFIHRINLPLTALKRIEEVLPFELEAQVPVDLDELAWNYRLLKRRRAEDPLIALAGAASIESVRARISLVVSALGREPERIGCGPLPLANLSLLESELAVEGPIGIVDLGGSRTELVLLSGGEPAFARTLSRGVDGLPASAPALDAELRQTLHAWTTKGGAPVTALYLVGAGAYAPGAEIHLSGELGIPTRVLGALSQAKVEPDQAPFLPQFAKAIGLAMGLGGRPRGLDLRRGALAFQRGYGFVKDKAPLLTGLGAAIFISFLFSTAVELRVLGADREVLGAALASVTKDVLGEETSDPAQVTELLEKGGAGDKGDPMPHMDAFDVLVELSKAIPPAVTHDIQEFDMARGHVKINGIVGSTEDAQLVASALGTRACFSDVKIGKITQQVNSERQKYILDFDVKCPEDEHATTAKKKKPEGGGAEPSATGTP